MKILSVTLRPNVQLQPNNLSNLSRTRVESLFRNFRQEVGTAGRKYPVLGPWHERCAAGSPKHDAGLGDRREARQLAWHPGRRRSEEIAAVLRPCDRWPWQILRGALRFHVPQSVRLLTPPSHPITDSHPVHKVCRCKTYQDQSRGS